MRCYPSMRPYSEWVSAKAAIADRLESSECGGTYAEAAIILCAAISAMAASAWPGKGCDRKRFIEIVQRSSTQDFDATLVSVPLLAARSAGWRDALELTPKAFYLTGREVDRRESQLVAIAPANDKCGVRGIRKYSYAALLYDELRCGFVHQYRAQSRATEHDGLRGIVTSKRTEITYVNSASDPNAPAARQIYFPSAWIAGLATGVAAGLDQLCAQQNKGIFQPLDLPKPKTWWIAGS